MSLGKNIKKQKLIPEVSKSEDLVAPLERKMVKTVGKPDRARRQTLRSKYNEELKLLQGVKLQLIVFPVGKNRFALEIKYAQEVLLTPSITPSPYYPPSVKGVMEVRGEMVVALDLERKFAFVQENDSFPYSLLIRSDHDQKIGVLLRQVPTTFKVDGSSLIAASGLMAEMAHEETYIKSVVKSADGLIYLLDMEELIANEQIPVTQ